MGKRDMVDTVISPSQPRLITTISDTTCRSESSNYKLGRNRSDKTPPKCQTKISSLHFPIIILGYIRYLKISALQVFLLTPHGHC